MAAVAGGISDEPTKLCASVELPSRLSTPDGRAFAMMSASLSCNGMRGISVFGHESTHDQYPKNMSLVGSARIEAQCHANEVLE